MSKRIEITQPIAFAVVMGVPRVDMSHSITIGGSEEVIIPGYEATQYVVGYDETTNEVVMQPFDGDIAQFPDAPVFNWEVDAQKLRQLGFTFNQNTEIRSPRVMSSKRLPNDQVSEDFVGGNEMLQLLYRLSRLEDLNGVGTDEMGLQLLMGVVQTLEEKYHWLPPGPHMFEQPEDNDDGVQF